MGNSMKDIVADIIKGASNNSFGRPVNIEVSPEWTHLKVAEYAGKLTALSELGYSVKQAAEYLGLTEAQVQDIVAQVR